MEDAKRPTRKRENLVGERARVANRIKASLIRLGVRGIKPMLRHAACGMRHAAERLDALRTPEGALLPPNTLAELRRDVARLGFVREQIKQVEDAQVERLQRASGERSHTMMRLLAWGISRACRAAVPQSCGVQQADAQERETGPAIHGPLQHLQPVDLAFGRACGPGQVEGRLHGGEVVAQAGGELRQRRAGRVGEHGGQAFLALAAQQQVEALRNRDAVREFGSLRQESRDECLFGPG